MPMTLVEDGFSNRFTYQERKWGEVKVSQTGSYRSNRVSRTLLIVMSELQKSHLALKIENPLFFAILKMELAREQTSFIFLERYTTLLFCPNICFGFSKAKPLLKVASARFRARSVNSVWVKTISQILYCPCLHSLNNGE